VRYNIVTNEGERTSVTVFQGGKTYVATKESTSNFDRICDMLSAGVPLRSSVDTWTEQVIGLFDMSEVIAKKFDRVSDRVGIAGGRVLFDGEVQDSEITRAIVAYYGAPDLPTGEKPFLPLVRFMEKIATNPNEHSRDHLYRWLANHNFAIAEDGDIICYKSVRHDGLSSHSGSAYVNGVLVNGRIPNKPGTVIEMPRGDVTFDPRNGCSQGLHVANWSFARAFCEGPKLRLKVNPRDVVSVPTDASDQKMRVCRYYIIDQVDTEVESPLQLDFIERTARVVDVAPEPEPEPAAVPGKKKQAKAVAKKATPTKLPEYYEQNKPRHFMAESRRTLDWLHKEWFGKGASRKLTHEQLAKILYKEARARLATWPEGKRS
jgi:hypothetical protein